MTFPIYAFGYTGRKLDTLVEEVTRADGDPARHPL